MNIETGEIRKLTEVPEHDAKWVPLNIGEVIRIKGVRCQLTAVNPGKRRLSFTVVGEGGKGVDDE